MVEAEDLVGGFLGIFVGGSPSLFALPLACPLSLTKRLECISPKCRRRVAENTIELQVLQYNMRWPAYAYLIIGQCRGSCEEDKGDIVTVIL
jgi:hypothetical protein